MPLRLHVVSVLNREPIVVKGGEVGGGLRGGHRVSVLNREPIVVKDAPSHRDFAMYYEFQCSIVSR